MEAQTTMSRRDLEQALITKCWKEPEFRKQVTGDPKGMLEKHLGQKLPENLKIFVHEENPNTIHMTIPAAPSNVAELSDEDLERVAGGTDFALTVALVWVSIATVASAGVAVGAGVTEGTQGW